MLKYPIPKEKRVKLVKLYFHLATTPGMPTHIVASCVDAFSHLTSSKKKISVEDLRLPWKPIYDILVKDLFLTRRQFEIGYVHEALSRMELNTVIPGRLLGTWASWLASAADFSILQL